VIEQTPPLIQTITVAIVAGILMQIFAERVKLPSIAFLMLAGILLGPGVFGIINPASMGEGLEVLVSLAVALILFEGGLSLDLESLKTVNQSVRNILTIGIFITVTGSALAVHYILNISWIMSILFGAFISISGPTVINPILERIRIKRNLATILKTECILSDALGAFISVAVLEIILATKVSMSFFLYEFFLKIFIGSFIGYSCGWLLGKMLKKKSIGSDLKNLVVLAGVFGIYFLSNLAESNTGILAVIMAGYALQKENIPQLNTLKRFKGQLSIFLISVLFILISANLDLNNIKNLGWKGLAVIAILIFVVRPIAIFVSNHGLLSFREKLFVSWIGPKGIVSASVASLFGLILTKNAYTEGVIIESLVFLAIEEQFLMV
jgi:NhaP-type Na+/H+ or K+/H+ antiporter